MNSHLEQMFMVNPQAGLSGLLRSHLLPTSYPLSFPIIQCLRQANRSHSHIFALLSPRLCLYTYHLLASIALYFNRCLQRRKKTHCRLLLSVSPEPILPLQLTSSTYLQHPLEMAAQYLQPVLTEYLEIIL